MMKAWLMPAAVLLPVIGALCVCLCEPLRRNVRRMRSVVFATVSATAAIVICIALLGKVDIAPAKFLPRVPIYFRSDGIAGLFSVLTVSMWLLSTVFSFDYMSHGEREERYQTFSLLSLGALMGVCFSGNLVTTYIFYEMMTLATFPLVMHEQTKEAISAGMTYLYYSLAGAFLGLVGIFFLYRCADPAREATGGILSYAAGGFLKPGMTGTETAGLLVAVFFMLLGFGSKVGMFPLHGWLPKAHPVAPAPASALLSGNITKMGILFVIRVVYYSVGPSFLQGTWVQKTLLTLAMITVFLGSMLAFREKVMKKRLAYSTVSQTSYILAGLYLMSPEAAFTGAILHIVFHSVIKNLLFLCAGAVIARDGKTKVSEWKGLGRTEPAVMAVFTVGGLALVGIPPFSGFVSKWQIATGALASGVPVFRYCVPVILLISALLTAGYLITVSADAFFVPEPENAGNAEENDPVPSENRRRLSLRMAFPLFILAAAATLFGLFPNALTEFAASLFREF
ncbi:MAG: proton-conducting membrane transporter [Lachnospiraceae bacterium]|nr:proton-conducting membrane transporter [Lachnospiraceae bacterium]